MNEAAAYLLGVERLFENSPKVEFGEVAAGSGSQFYLNALPVEVEVEVGDGATMCFRVTPGDGSATRAFLRIRK